jgi:hypothetical protein
MLREIYYDRHTISEDVGIRWEDEKLLMGL